MIATSSPAPHPAISNITASTTFAPSPQPQTTTTPSPHPLVASSEELGTEPLTSAYLNTTIFCENWSIQSWTFPTNPISLLKRVNSASNIYIARNTTTGSYDSTYLTLRTHRPSSSFILIAPNSNPNRRTSSTSASVPVSA